MEATHLRVFSFKLSKIKTYHYGHENSGLSFQYFPSITSPQLLRSTFHQSCSAVRLASVLACWADICGYLELLTDWAQHLLQFRNSLMIWKHLINSRRERASAASYQVYIAHGETKNHAHRDVSRPNWQAIQPLETAKHGLILIVSPPHIFPEFGKGFQLWCKNKHTSVLWKKQGIISSTQCQQK